MSHTPGPWSRVKPLGARFWTLGRIRQHVAEPLPEENEKADWRLAEAAPDLLEALEKLMKSFDGVAYANWTTEMHAAKAAISKAKGE